jgi:tetratricopeptide (TPR) repeat protein
MKIFLILLLSIASIHSHACYFILGKKNGRVLVGYNEDWYKSNSKYWVEHPSKKEKFGAVFFGFGGEFKIAQGGVNEKGLFFDGNAIPKQTLNDSLKSGRTAAPVPVFKSVLKQCATVEEALNYLNKYYIPFIKSVQIILADATGAYAVIDLNGVVEKGSLSDGYRIITNFRSSDKQYFCYRYDLTEAQLGKRFENTVEEFENLLMKARQTYPGATVYSTISELNTQKINLYYNHSLNNKIEIDLRKSLVAGEKGETELEKVFPKRMISELIKTWQKKGVEGSLSFFDDEFKKSESVYQVDAEQLYDLTNVLLNRQHIKESLLIAQKNCEYYPNSDLAYEALGKSLLWNGRMREATQAYEKAKSLNSENRWANLVLDQLKNDSSDRVSNFALVLTGYASAKVIAVAGDFNEWQSLQNICFKNEDGNWQCLLTLPPGKYSYRFVADGRWIDDPGNPPIRELQKAFFVSEFTVK